MTTSNDGIAADGSSGAVAAVVNASKEIVPGADAVGILSGIDTGVID